jgi:hypothetical protein
MEMDLAKMNLTIEGLQHKIHTFEFIPGKTPLATLSHVIGAVVLYLLV